MIVLFEWFKSVKRSPLWALQKLLSRTSSCSLVVHFIAEGPLARAITCSESASVALQSTISAEAAPESEMAQATTSVERATFIFVSSWAADRSSDRATARAAGKSRDPMGSGSDVDETSTRRVDPRSTWHCCGNSRLDQWVWTVVLATSCGAIREVERWYIP